MYKCLQCGSEFIKIDDVYYCVNTKCHNSKNDISEKYIQQQRLDKVLEKFEPYTKDDNEEPIILAYYYKNGYPSHREYEAIIKWDIPTEQFYTNDWVCDLLTFDLDTVEHLIKDMEAHNE